MIKSFALQNNFTDAQKKTETTVKTKNKYVGTGRDLSENEVRAKVDDRMMQINAD